MTARTVRWTAMLALALMGSPGHVLAEETRILKQRLSDEASDEQRLDNCQVPAERRAPIPRPDCPGKARPAAPAAEAAAPPHRSPGDRQVRRSRPKTPVCIAACRSAPAISTGARSVLLSRLMLRYRRTLHGDPRAGTGPGLYSIQRKAKAFTPSLLGFTMSRHAP